MKPCQLGHHCPTSIYHKNYNYSTNPTIPHPIPLSSSRASIRMGTATTPPLQLPQPTRAHPTRSSLSTPRLCSSRGRLRIYLAQQTRIVPPLAACVNNVSFPWQKKWERSRILANAGLVPKSPNRETTPCEENAWADPCAGYKKTWM